jgi:hypothetical protein
MTLFSQFPDTNESERIHEQACANFAHADLQVAELTSLSFQCVASGFLASLRATPGRPLRGRLTARGAAFAFRPREGGSEELSGVFGGAALDFELGDPGVKRLHLRQQFVDALVPGGDLCQELIDPRQQRRHKMGAIACSANRFILCCMPSVNQLAAVGSTPQTRVTTPQRVE